MELYLFRRSEYERLYNCTGSEEWINKHSLEERTQFAPQAWASIIMCAICYVLYVPVMLSIWKHIKGNSCFQLLFYIGLMDMFILWILGFVQGFLSLNGAVFCSYPNLIYITGVLCNSIWRAESCADWLLAINRCLDMAYPELTKTLFQGYKTSLWLLISTIYFMWWIIFSKPCIFSSLHFSWFFNPYVGYRDDPDGTYIVPMHAYHNLFIVISFPTIYAVFMFMMHLKTRAASRMGQNSQKISKAEMMTFIQVALISLLNSCTCSVYVYMQFVPPSQVLITMAEFGWFFIHGLPPVIFLALNKTVRQDCYKLFFKTFKRNQVTHIHGVTVIRPDTEQLRRQQQTTY